MASRKAGKEVAALTGKILKAYGIDSDDEELDRVADLLAFSSHLPRLQGRRRQHDRRQASDGGRRVRPRRTRLGTDAGGGQGHGDRRGGER